MLELPAEFRPETLWLKVPHGLSFGGDCPAVAVDQTDRLILLTRGPVPVLVFDSDGTYLYGFGEGEFDRPHGLAVDNAGNIYVVDDGGHFVQKRSPTGDIIMTIGARGESATKQSGEPFNRPTGVAVHAESGDIYITDGYGNARVHQFGATGQHIRSWGASGSVLGKFSVPHGIAIVGSRAVVCDRENHRIQVFSLEGEPICEWHSHRPAAVAASPYRGVEVLVGQLGPSHGSQSGVPNLGCRVDFLDQDGAQVASLGDPLPGFQPSQFIAPHGLAVDSTGSIYVGEVTWSFWGVKQPADVLRDAVCVRKWRPVESGSAGQETA